MAFRNCFDVLVDIGEGAEEQASRSRSRSEKEQGPGETYKFGETPDEPIELSRPLVWIDLEMTGLDLTNDVILQIAVLITDGSLETVVEGPEIVVHHSDDVLARMNEWCVEHHGASGLTLAVAESGVTMREAEQQVLEFVRRYVKPKEGLVAGSSVHVDLSFLKKDMPELADYFHYRIVDVSTIIELASRWYPNAWKRAPKKTHAHTAMSDIRESLAELRYYKQAVFKPPPKEPNPRRSTKKR